MTKTGQFPNYAVTHAAQKTHVMMKDKAAPAMTQAATHLAEGQRAVRVLGDHEGIVAALEHWLQVVHVHHRHHHVREGRGVLAVTHPHPQRELWAHTCNEATTISPHTAQHYINSSTCTRGAVPAQAVTALTHSLTPGSGSETQARVRSGE